MVKKNIPEINIDEIMHKIREEIAKRKKHENRAPEDNIDSPDIRETTTWRIIKKIQYKLQKYAFYSFIYNVAFHFKQFIPKYKKHLVAGDLHKYHDEEFIRNSYRKILKRGPDAHGFNDYLMKLRSGTMNKTEILGRLRYSKEGRKKPVKIKDLFLKFLANTSFRIPVIGYVLKLLISIIRFPQIIRDIQGYEAFTNARFTENTNLFKSVNGQLAQKADLQGVNEQLAQKADLQQLAQKADLQSVNEQLAQKADLQGVNEQLAQKADLQSVNEQLAQKADLQIIEEIKSHLNNVFVQVKDHKFHILDQNQRLTLLFEEIRKRLPKPISTKQIKNLLSEENHLFDAMYVAFEDQFRGTREDIKKRAEVYLPYIKKMNGGVVDSPVLDVGCGRGEWLELLKENGYAAKGIDSNRVMIQQCKDIELDVIASDVIEYLRNQKSNSLGAITGFHIIEHLTLSTLMKLLAESLRTLKINGFVIFETPNPANLMVSACNFYTDPTHRSPLPSSLMKFLFEFHGFSSVEILNLHPCDEKLKLSGSDLAERFNTYFYGQQDYAIIGRKE